MFVLHATWLPSDHPASPSHGLAVWGETAAAPVPARRGRRPKVDRHPFAAGADALGQALHSLPADVPFTAAALAVALPSRNNRPLPSPELLWEVEDTSDGEPVLAVWQLAGCLLSSENALRWLIHLPARDQLPPGLTLGTDLRFWRLAARLALSLLARQRFVPSLLGAVQPIDVTRRGRPDTYRAVWQPWLDDPADRARLVQLTSAMPPVCRAVKLAESAASPPAPTALLADFLLTITNTHVRRWAAPGRKPITSAGVRPELRWRNALLRADAALDDSERNLAPLARQIQEWLAQLRTEAGAAFRLCFRLEAPEAGAVRREARTWTLRYLLQALDDLSLLVPAEQVWRARGQTLRYLDRRFDQPQERMLAGLGKASRLCAPVEASLHAARPEAAALTTDEAYTFLRETALLLEESGFGVLAPQWWGRRGAANRVGARLKLRPTRKQAPTGGVGGMSFERVVAVDWELALGDETLTLEELERLARLKMPLVQIRGQWAVLDPAQIEATIKLWEAQQKTPTELSLPEALRLLLAQDEQVAGVNVAGVSAEGWLADLVEELRTSADQMAMLPQPPAFNGQLRPYQQRGFSWLAFLRRCGFGACLADDMGLGKCLLGSSLIYANGIVQKVEYLWEQFAGAISFDGEGFWSTPSTAFEINAIDVTSGDIISAPVHRLYRQHVSEPLRTVTLEDGSSIAITKRHKLLTNRGWTANLQVGDYVCVPARLYWRGTSVDLDLVKLLAWQISEGYEDPRSACVRITQNNHALLEELGATLETVGRRYGIRVNTPTVAKPGARSPYLRCTSRAYQRFLAERGYQWGERSATKTIPNFIMQADDEGIRVFLRNFFDAEGSAVPSMASIEIATASSLLMQQLVTLLRRFGIWMRVTPKRKRATNGRGIFRTYQVVSSAETQPAVSCMKLGLEISTSRRG